MIHPLAIIATGILLLHHMRSKPMINGLEPLKIRLRKGVFVKNKKLDSPKDTFHFLKKVIGSKMLLQEMFVMIFYKRPGHPIAYTIHSLGATDATLVDVKLVGATSISIGAKYVLLSHNHPSGKLLPSRADLELTKSLHIALQSVNIGIIDHLIVTTKGYYSFKEEGLL